MSSWCYNLPSSVSLPYLIWESQFFSSYYDFRNNVFRLKLEIAVFVLCGCCRLKLNTIMMHSTVNGFSLPLPLLKLYTDCLLGVQRLFLLCIFICLTALWSKVDHVSFFFTRFDCIIFTYCLLLWECPCQGSLIELEPLINYIFFSANCLFWKLALTGNC